VRAVVDGGRRVCGAVEVGSSGPWSVWRPFSYPQLDSERDWGGSEIWNRAPATTFPNQRPGYWE
jgi:hypothetical protein